MGLKEGYRQGKQTAETIFRVSSNYASAGHPRLKDHLLENGVSGEDVLKLMAIPALNSEEIGYTLGGIVFFFRHGGIWNSKDTPRRQIKSFFKKS